MQYKVTFLIILYIAFTAVGCSKDESKRNKFPLKIETDVEGLDRIVLWGYYANGETVSIGEGKKTEGGYSLLIEDPLRSSFLYRIDGAADFLNAPTISNPKVMCYNAVTSFHAFNKKQYVGRFSLPTVQYIYVTDDVSITGAKLYENGTPFQTFDLHFKKGWNAFSAKVYSPSNDNPQILFTSDIENSLTWEFTRQ